MKSFENFLRDEGIIRLNKLRSLPQRTDTSGGLQGTEHNFNKCLENSDSIQHLRTPDGGILFPRVAAMFEMEPLENSSPFKCGKGREKRQDPGSVQNNELQDSGSIGKG